MTLSDGFGELCSKVINAKSLCCICLIVLITVGGIIGSVVRNVDHDEYGIVYNSFTKEISDEIRLEGRHFLPVGSELIIFKSRFITINFDYEDGNPVKCLTKNGLEMVLDMNMRYQWRQTEILDLFREFGSQEKAHDYLVVLARESFRVVCSKYDAEKFYYERQNIETSMLDALTSDFDRAQAHATLNIVNLINIDLPRRYNNAIEAGQLALQDTDKATQEREQLLIRARTREDKAEQQQRILLNDAEQQAAALLFKAERDKEALDNKFGSLAEAFEFALNSTGMAPEAFITSYLQSKLLREATQGAAPIVSFS